MVALPVLQSATPQTRPARPDWLRVRAPTGENYQRLRQLITEQRLNTVCSSAACPNIGECWELGTATFMILGRICTRACRFCDVDSYSRPGPVDLDEPARLADTVEKMGLKHVVLTSVTRDDLADGGAKHFANCLNAIRMRMPETSLEVLTPDFLGNEDQIQIVIDANPQVFNHNVETCERLTPRIRSGAQYFRSLGLLKYVKQQAPHIQTKSGIMLGLGETNDEVMATLRDMRAHNVDILTIGQYLRPSDWHHPIERYATPEEFAMLGTYARALGFSHVESGPFVRSSYHAEKGVKKNV